LRFRWVDLANVVRAKALFMPTVRGRLLADDSVRSPHGGAPGDDHLQALLATAVSISQAQFAIPVTADSVITATGLLPTRDLTLVPDLDTIAPLPYSPGAAAVACDVFDHGLPSPLCPRGFLRRMDDAARALGLAVRVGVELEFMLLAARDAQLTQPQPQPPLPEPADGTMFAQEQALDAHHRFLADVTAALEAQGIGVAQLHAEAAAGQIELSLWHLPALAAADAVVSVRQTVHAVAAQHGLAASFLPVVDPVAGGSGLHLHLSLTGDADDGLGAAGPHFIAGLLDNFEALLAVTAPTAMSYERFRPHFWVGAFEGWGLENKEAPIRVTQTPGGRPRDVEFKAIDATANPYLAVAAVLAAGLDGVRRGIAPPPPLEGDPGLLDDAERARIGARPLPINLGGPLAALESNETLRAAMGEQLHRVYLTVKRFEDSALSQLDPHQRRLMLLHRY
jgi:glutamine synthetase